MRNCYACDWQVLPNPFQCCFVFKFVTKSNNVCSAQYQIKSSFLFNIMHTILHSLFRPFSPVFCFANNTAVGGYTSTWTPSNSAFESGCHSFPCSRKNWGATDWNANTFIHSFALWFLEDRQHLLQTVILYRGEHLDAKDTHGFFTRANSYRSSQPQRWCAIGSKRAKRKKTNIDW